MLINQVITRTVIGIKARRCYVSKCTYRKVIGDWGSIFMVIM